MQPRIPAYIVIGRIAAVVGLSLAIASGIFMLLAGWVLWGGVALLAAAPFGAMIFLIEYAPGGSSIAQADSADKPG